ncbi:MAG TPA: hypothetical protein V6D47_12670 [Oscillatoriaceae cyanobacterium]
MWGRAAIGAIVVFVVVIVLTLVWARRKVANSGPTRREQLLHLAAIAAGDGSGHEMLALLEALEQEPVDCPVQLDWVARPAYEGKAGGMLVRITWDGNEWRRLWDAATLRAAIAAYLAERAPSPRLALMQQDLATLQ